MEEVKEKELFDELGLEVATSSVEVGNTYPIFGMITKIINDEPGQVLVELNYNIEARLNILDGEKVNLLKERAFESGIFVSKVLQKDPNVVVECKTVIFGRKQGYNA